MSRTFNTMLFREDWSRHPLGNLNRDNSARGEYMAQMVPPNVNGWYHNCACRGGKSDREHSPFEVKRQGKRRVLSKPGGGAWTESVVLTTGPKRWRDYIVTCDIAIGKGRVGLVARYRTSRDYYAILFENNEAKLVRRLEGAWTVLAVSPFKPPRKAIRVQVGVDGRTISAQAGSIKLHAQDSCIQSGGIGLLGLGEARFGTVSVKTSPKEKTRLEQEDRRMSRSVGAKQKSFPQMRLLAAVDLRGHAIGRQIRFADLDGDGREEILLASPTYVNGRKWRYNRISKLTALNLDGKVLWERGKWATDAMDITADLPFQAADRGKGMDVVACFGSSLEVLDPLTGKTRQKVTTPKPPKMEPYWDEINQYFGDGHGDDLPRLVPDVVFLCNLTGRHPHGDLYIKDRYHNVWGLDGRSFKVLWHHRCNTGHFPYATDWNGDGRDELLLGYSRLDSRGNLIGRLFLGDHPDGCFTYKDAWGVRHNLHPCGEAGFIDERAGGRLDEVHLGHVQHLSLGNFLPDRPDLERIVVMYHGNEGIIVLLDCENQIIRKTERYASGAVCQPVNWTGDGRELIAYSPRHGDGGLWNSQFETVVPFPDDNRPGRYMEVHDMLGLGVDQLVVWDEQRLHVYGPDPLPRKRRYAPKRPGPNLSNYQVNFSVPGWK